MVINKKLFFSAIITGVVLGAMLNITPRGVQKTAAANIFGGPIEDTQDCYCSDTFWIKVGQPVAGTVVIGPNSKIFDYGDYMRNGINVLGTYNSGGVCEYGEYCDESREVTLGTVDLMGTSR